MMSDGVGQEIRLLPRGATTREHGDREREEERKKDGEIGEKGSAATWHLRDCVSGDARHEYSGGV